MKGFDSIQNTVDQLCTKMKIDQKSKSQANIYSNISSQQ